VKGKAGRTDRFVRQLPLVTDEHVRLLSDRGAKQALFEEIMTMTTTTEQRRPVAAPAGRRRRGRHLAAFVTGLGTVAVAGTAWAVYTSTGSTTSSGCYITEDEVSVINAVTGDPVRDCASVWERETGTSAPPLVAYDNGAGGVAVVPVDRAVPDGWTRREPGVTQAPSVIRLEAALDDSIDGLRSDCHALTAAQAIADRELASAGLTGWETVSERGQADGRSSCTYYLIDAASQRVVLIPSQGLVTSGDDSPHVQMAAAMRDGLRSKCLSVAAAAAVARDAAAKSGVEGVVVHEVLEPGTACASIDMRVGGAVEVTVRGTETTP
jgi:hypothetical protein